MKCWIVMHYHRYGTDVWPVFAKRAPTEKSVIAKIEDWEGDTRDDEWVEIIGPFEIPKERK